MKTSVNLEKKSLWSYYWEAVTSKYAAFNEGASRRQYWSFVLFYTLFNILITFFIVMGEAFSVKMGGRGVSPPSPREETKKGRNR